MRKTIKLFLDEVIQKMPQHAEIIREEIMGWIGYLNEDDTEFTHGFGEFYEYDNYVSMYKVLSAKVNTKLNNLEVVKSLSTYSITHGLQFVEDGHLNPLLETISSHFSGDGRYYHMISKEDVDMFSLMYDKHILGK